MTTSPSLLFVSNGYGEDLIGAHIALAAKSIGFYPIAFPLVGAGFGYLEHQIDRVGTSPIPPSGGIMRRLRDVVGDLRNGIVATSLRQRRIISQTASHCHGIVAVGDVFCLIQATAGKKLPAIFLPTAKSDLFMPHTPLEYWIIRRLADRIFPRDAITASRFNERQLPADYLGNPMMDGLLDLPPLRREINGIHLALLPGSRSESSQNLELELRVLDHMSQPIFAWICTSKSMDTHPHKSILIAHNYTEIHSNRWVNPSGITISFTHTFSSAVRAADVVIGLAGTANEQAVWLGKRVVAFPGSGPQSLPIRFNEQKKLLGNNLIYVDTNHPSTVALKVMETLKLPPLPEPLPQHAASQIIHSARDLFEQ